MMYPTCRQQCKHLTNMPSITSFESTKVTCIYQLYQQRLSLFFRGGNVAPTFIDVTFFQGCVAERLQHTYTVYRDQLHHIPYIETNYTRTDLIFWVCMALRNQLKLLR